MPCCLSATIALDGYYMCLLCEKKVILPDLKKIMIMFIWTALSTNEAEVKSQY